MSRAKENDCALLVVIRERSMYYVVDDLNVLVVL